MTDTAGNVLVDGKSLTSADVVAVARKDTPVAVDEDAREAVRESRERVESVVGTDEPVYGVNTGFGELADRHIPSERVEELQANLVRSHASGAGEELPRETVRAMLITRLNALAKGYSGVREVILDYLVEMLNGGVHPVVRARGSLGASGDLAPLAHLSLVLFGEGEAAVDPPGDANDGETRDEPRRLSGEEALATVGLEPLTLEAKEGLALINGTQLTVGLGALLVVDGERLLRAADAAGALTTEVTMGTTATADAALMDVRPHGGQAATARNVKRLTRNSEIVESHRNCDRVQDPYSIRCLPQVHGAVRDAVDHLRGAVETELNSATDNPLVFPRDAVDDRASGTERGAVLSGGNFHGAPLAHRLDYVVGALTSLATISERRVERMLNPNVQEAHLPPFLATESGVESGMMIPQYAAAALVNDCRAAGRHAADNTPVSGGQEDHVSMSAGAALTAREVLQKVQTAVAVELLVAAQAAEFVDDDLAHGVGTGAAYEAVRAVSPALDGDRSLASDIDAVDALIGTGTLDDALRAALDEKLV